MKACDQGVSWNDRPWKTKNAYPTTHSSMTRRARFVTLTSRRGPGQSECVHGRSLNGPEVGAEQRTRWASTAEPMRSQPTGVRQRTRCPSGFAGIVSITGEPRMPTPITIAPKRILIMDDEILVASVLRDVLKHQGYAVELASGGEAVLNALRRERADLVLLDINMPGMSGLEVLKHVSERHPDVPVIMVTALTDDTALSTAMR